MFKIVVKNISLKDVILSLFICISSLASAETTQYYVSSTGSDTTGNGSLTSPWLTVQQALWTIPYSEDDVDLNLRAGTYILSDVLYIDSSRGGSSTGTFTIKSYDTETATLDGSLIAEYSTMISIDSASYVAIEGLEMTNLIGNKTGIYVSGSSSNIRLYNNVIHGMYWTTDATAALSPTSSDNLNPIAIVGNSATAMTSISIIDNKIYDLTTGYSEAVKVVGNVNGFTIDGNLVHDVTNICIVAAGNYSWVGLTDTSLNHARNGTISNNETYNCISPIADSAGIYVDGGQDIAVTSNYSHNNTVGFSVGCEEVGDTTGITLSSNISSDNTGGGLILGTMTTDATVSSVTITGNKFSGNYTTAVWGGAPIIFSNASEVTITDNTISSLSQYMITANGTVTSLTINSNTYSSSIVASDSAVFAWVGINGVNYFSFDSYKLATGQDSLSTF